jgi:hypothetical protein
MRCNIRWRHEVKRPPGEEGQLEQMKIQPTAASVNPKP